MINYEKTYFGLFGAIENAIRAIENQNYLKAHEILIRAQREAEETYISAEE